MLETPLISVIVPVYRVEEYLDECVQSIVGQTYQNLQIILVDDGSPDGCPELCDRWAGKDPRVQVIHRENAGASAARNAALDIAAGDYIGFVDSDDYIDLRLFEIMLRNISDTNCGIAVCYHCLTNDPTTPPEKPQPVVYDALGALNAFFCGREIGSAVWDKLFRRELFEGIRFPEGETNEEYPILIPLLTRAKSIVHTGKTLYHYRTRPGSVTNTTWKTDAGIVLKHLDEMESQIAELGLMETRKSFRLFRANSAYFPALSLDKNYHRINENAKENFKKYLKIMRSELWIFLMSPHVKAKDKLLYLMLLTRTLRPLYGMLGKL